MKRSAQPDDVGLEGDPLHIVVLGNLLSLAVTTAGAAACWFTRPFFGVAYLIVSMILLYGVLPRLICDRCHYDGKRCGTGWSLLAALWFGRGSPGEFSESAGVRFAPFLLALIILVPLICLAVLAVQQATTTVVILGAFLLAGGFYLLGPRRGAMCTVCRMRQS